jgi:hypothetical protein
MIATIVDTDALLQVIWTSLLAGVGVTAAYGVAIAGATRALELGREGRTGRAVLYAVVGAAATAAVVGAIVAGIVLLTDK